jgi:predicted acetyltransferase
MNKDFYRPFDEEKINHLYNKIFNFHRTIDQWKWEYLQTPHGKSFIRVLRDGQDIIGHFSLLPFQMCNKDEVVLTGKIEGIMLHLEYRGHGLYSEFVKESLLLAKTCGFQVTWVTFTPATRPLKRAGYTEVLDFYTYTYPLSLGGFSEFLPNKLQLCGNLLGRGTYPIFKRLSHFKRHLEIQEVSLSEYTSFFENWRLYQRSFSVFRSYDFLKWRFCDNPYKLSYAFVRLAYKNQAVAYAILVQRNNSLWIDDLMFLDDMADLLATSILDLKGNALLLSRYTSVKGKSMLGHFGRKTSSQMLVHHFDGQKKWLLPSTWYFTGLFREGVS